MPRKSTLSLYWKCQLTGWALASLYWNLVGYIGSRFSPWLAVVHFVGDLLIYIPVTHLYRNFSIQQGWHRLTARQLIPRLAPAIVVMGGLFMVLTISKNYWLRYWFEPGFTGSLSVYFREQWLPVGMAGIRLMSIWLLAYYGYHFAQREINATRETARLGIIARDAQLNNLTAQLNPHFFFNSLNNIKALVIDNPPGARRAIDLLSEVLRTALYNRDTALITLQQEMSLVKDYLELEKMRFEERLQVQIDVDDSLSSVPVLPLSVQTLVENAIKHGIAQRKAGGSLHITVSRRPETLQVVVANPGKLSYGQQQGLGLKNLCERLDLQFNGKGSLQLTQSTNDTVLATLQMPLS